MSYPFGAANALQSQVATPVAGFALQNGTPTILTWTAPNDGKLHRFEIFGTVSVTVAETGGAILVSYTLPDGTNTAHTVFPGGATVGDIPPAFAGQVIVKPGSVVTLFQNTALTLGAAVAWAEIWGS